MENQRARIASAIVFFVNGCVLGGIAPNFPFLREKLHLTDRELGECLLVAAFGAFFALPMAGGVIHRLGTRRAVTYFGTAMCLLVPFVIAAPGALAFCVLLFLTSASNGMLDPSMNSQAVHVQDRFEKPILSVIHGFWSIGGLTAGLLVALAGWIGIHPVGMAACVDAVLLFALLIAVRHYVPSDASGDDEPAFAIPHGLVLTIGLLCVCAFAAEGAGWDWSAVYLRTSLGVSRQMAAIGFSAFSWGMALARFTGDAVVHRLGNARSLLLGGIVGSAAFVSAVSVKDPVLAIAGFGIAGMGMANVVPILFRAAGSVPGTSTSRGIAGAAACGYTAFLVAPPLVGFIGDRWSLGLGVGAMGALAAVAAILGPRVLRMTNIKDTAAR